MGTRKLSHSRNSLQVADHGVMTVLFPTMAGRSARQPRGRPSSSMSMIDGGAGPVVAITNSQGESTVDGPVQ